MRNYKLFGIIAFAFLSIAFFTQCTKIYDNSIIELPSYYPNGEKDTTTTSSDPVRVNFMGAIENMVLTRAVQSLPVGRYASIYAFNSGEFTSSPVSMGIYETKSLGIFTPTSTPMYLLGDDYDFYSI